MPPQSAPEAAGPAAAPPLRPAASLILISRTPKLHVLWVRRAEANPFLGGFHSFPGGRMSPEDGPTDGEEALELAMIRCAVRETFEETGIFVGVNGPKPDQAARRLLREQVLNGNAEFWPSIERIGLSLDRAAFRMSGRWVTPPFSRARFDTMFFVSELEQPESPDVWPGELSSGEWVEPDRALRLWEEDRVTLAMPTLHAIRVIGEGADDLPARLRAVPEANGVPSRHVILHPGIVMVPLRTETLAPATHTNAAVIGDAEIVIVDPGTADSGELEALYEVVDGATARGGKVTAVLLTHRHKDHVSGADAVRARYGAPVWGHGLISDRVRLDRELRDGDRIELKGPHRRRVLALHTPGHSRSHIAFFEERSRTLCAGDLVSTLGTVVVDPPDGNMSDYLRSLDRLRELQATALIPGHGPPSRGVGHLLAALLEHRRMREARILSALKGGPMTEEALREEVYRDTPGAPPALAARTLEAHLERLVEEGRIRKDSGRVMLAK